MKRLFFGPTNSPGIPHHKATKVVAGLEGCSAIQGASQGETKDGAKREGIVKRNQAKARGGAKKEDNGNTNSEGVGARRHELNRARGVGRWDGYSYPLAEPRLVEAHGDSALVHPIGADRSHHNTSQYLTTHTSST